jgi:diguanylate cyclase (GGDEF)-like protein
MIDSAPLPRILIVDESRMARVALVRQIREFYEFREEADGEAAWQVLVLDHSIDLVICALSLPVLDGDALLRRVRSSRQSRVAQIPMLMIASDSEETNERARLHGASGFIKRGVSDAELLSRIGSLLKEARSRNQPEKETEQQESRNPETGIFTRKYIEWQAQRAMSHAAQHNSEVSIMAIGFDDAGALSDEYGADLIKRLQRRLIAVLSGKMHKEASLGHGPGDQLFIVSPETSSKACEAFSNRLREAIHAASITVGNRRLTLSISIGIGNSPMDGAGSAGALIGLASGRLKAAQQAGGNRVLAGGGGVAENTARTPELTLERALGLLREGHESTVVQHLAELCEQAMPFLKLLDRELALRLPLAEVEKRLSARGRGQKTED